MLMGLRVLVRGWMLGWRGRWIFFIFFTYMELFVVVWRVWRLGACVDF